MCNSKRSVHGCVLKYSRMPQKILQSLITMQVSVIGIQYTLKHFSKAEKFAYQQNITRQESRNKYSLPVDGQLLDLFLPLGLQLGAELI